MFWPPVSNLESIRSPGLLVDPDRVQGNIGRMIAMVGRLQRLRPHLKTHKTPEVVAMQLEAGISRFKAATLAEAEMAASLGAPDILLAHQPVGPNIARMGDLRRRFPNTAFAAIVDDPHIATRLGDCDYPLRLFIDVDCGMHRSGIPFGDGLDALRATIEAQEGVEFAGLHVYDGHLHDPSLESRTASVHEVIAAVENYQRTRPAPTIIAGGSPTFGIWAAETDWECSPGTTLYWDAGYARAFPDLEFEIAAVLLTRVISKPGANRLCLDLGHKAVAAENPLERRVFFAEFPDAAPLSHSEEHFVLETAEADKFAVGDALIGYPQHICPTVALHAYATLVRDGAATSETWRVAARNR